MVEHLALARAHRRRHARAEHGGEPLDEPADDRPALVLGRARARDEPVERPAVAQHRDAGEADADGQHREGAGEHRRHRHTSTLVVRRMSTNAVPHSAGADHERRDARERRRHLAHHAGGDQVHQHDRGQADARHDVGRVDRAGEQRADLADQVLARLERVAELVERPHGVAAGALLDHERRHQHAELARRQAVAQRLQRVLDRLAHAQLLDHDAHLRRGRLGQLARGELHGGRQREAGRRAVGEHAREVGELRHEGVAAAAAQALDVEARRADRDRDREDDRDRARAAAGAARTRARRSRPATPSTRSTARDLRARAREPDREPLALPRAAQAALERAADAAERRLVGPARPARRQLGAPRGPAHVDRDAGERDDQHADQQQERLSVLVHQPHLAHRRADRVGRGVQEDARGPARPPAPPSAGSPPGSG